MSFSIVNAQNNDYDIKLDYEYYGMDLRSEHSYYPDKEDHIRGLDYIKISSDKDNIILNISDSLFVDNTPYFLSVFVDDGKNSDILISSVRLMTKETNLHIHKLIGDKDYVRVIICITKNGDNDAKRVLEIRKNT